MSESAAGAVAPNTLSAALIQLQARLPRITKDATAQVGSREYAYANLASIHDAIFPLLKDCGLYWTCCPTLMDGQFVLDYALTHVSGASAGGQYPLPVTGSPQQIGSAITYARRYALTAILGIAPAEDDDDGQAAETAAAQWRPPANPRTRKAQRSHGTPSDDPWYDQGQVPAENAPDTDAPASITSGQRAKIMALFNKAAIFAREDRLAYAMSKLDLPELATSNDLSARQASQLIICLESEGES